MTAFSGGGSIEWSNTMMKPILSVTYGAFNKSDANELVQSIINGEEELLRANEKCEDFYITFCVLAADYLSSGTPSASKEELELYCRASKILIAYLISRLQSQLFSMTLDSEKPRLSTTYIKQFLPPIKALCTATSQLSRTEQYTLAAALKTVKLPQNIKSTTSDNVGESSSNLLSTDAKPERSDLSNTILKQLSKPLLNVNGDEKLIGNEPIVPIIDAKQNEEYFIQKNVSSLRDLQAADVLLEICLKLPYIANYSKETNKFQQSGTFVLPPDIRHNLQFLVNEISIIWSVVGLPIFEPMSDLKIRNLTNLSLSCLKVSISISMAINVLGLSSTLIQKNQSANNTATQSCVVGQNSMLKVDDENIENMATIVVDTVVSIHQCVGRIFEGSSRVGGDVYQNYVLLGAWILCTGLNFQISGWERGIKDEGKDGTSKNGKIQQSFSVLSLALATEAISLVKKLFQDTSIDMDNEKSVDVITVESLDVLAKYTALKRIKQILGVGDGLVHFLLDISSIIYQKGCSLKRTSKLNDDAYAVITGSITFCDSDPMSSNYEGTTGEDDDSERILGLWFEETLTFDNADHKDLSDLHNAEMKVDANRSKECTYIPVVPNKGAPEPYFTLVVDIYQFLNNCVMSQSHNIVEILKTSMDKCDVMTLSVMIKNLDSENGQVANFYGADLQPMYNRFSESLTLFTHNLLSQKILNERLENEFLDYLDVNPDDEKSKWPLRVYPRTFAILAQIVVCRPTREATCAKIWSRVVNTLVDRAINPNLSAGSTTDDLNIEHAQLLLFFFNSLSFMHKKTTLLLIAKGVVKIVQEKRTLTEESQFHHVSRLLLFLDHIVKHLYDPPSFLLEQVQWNLLGAGMHGIPLSTTEESLAAEESKCPWKPLEDNYGRYTATGKSISPLFYHLSSNDFNCQEVPRLDGLALNFLLGNATELKYHDLIEALLSIVRSIEIVEKLEKAQQDEKNAYKLTCAIQYCVSLAWRMLLQLPTSVVHMEHIIATRCENVESTPFMLYTSIWGLRSANKAFSGWLKDALSKQPVSQSPDTLLKSVADITSRIKYDLCLLKNVISVLMPLNETDGVMVAKKDLPSFFNLMLCDTLLCKLRFTIDDSNCTKSNDNDLNKVIDGSASDGSDSNEISPHIILPSKSLQAHLVRDLMPQMIKLADVIFTYIRSRVLHQMQEMKDSHGAEYSLGDLTAFQSIFAISSCSLQSTKHWADQVMQQVPHDIPRKIFEKNDNLMISPHLSHETYINQPMPSIGYAMTVMNFHMYTLSGQAKFTIEPSLDHLLKTTVQFISDHLRTVTENEEICSKISNALLPMALDMSTTFLYPNVSAILEKILGSEKYLVKTHVIVFSHLYSLMMNYAWVDCCHGCIQENIIIGCVEWFCKLVEENYGRLAIDQFFSKQGQGAQYGLHELLITMTSKRASQCKKFTTLSLKAYNTLINYAERNQNDPVAKRLLTSLLKFIEKPKKQLQTLFKHIIIDNYELDGENIEISEKNKTEETISKDENNELDNPAESKLKPIQPENHKFLNNLIRYITTRNDLDEKETIVCTMLEVIIPNANKLMEEYRAVGFMELMSVMIQMADAAPLHGHTILFASATSWLKKMNEVIKKNKILSKIESDDSSCEHVAIINAIGILFNYVSDILTALSPSSVGRFTIPPWDSDLASTLDFNADWPEELCGIDDDDDDITIDDIEEDDISNKLCTFTVTQKEFMNQHWYHCHTCEMNDKLGVCSVCVRVCHKGHDVTYSKYGNFFCDCGAESKNTCQALSKRSSNHSNDKSPSGSSNGHSHGLSSNLNRKTSSISQFFDTLMGTVSRTRMIVKDKQKLATLSKQLEPQRDKLMSYLWDKSSLIDSMLSIASDLIPVYEKVISYTSPVGSHNRAIEALKKTHTTEKVFQNVESLMTHILGSQEGTFENVKMSFTGEQGQNIRQLINNHLLRRVSMCCLSSSRRQHLVAVSQDKGKVMVHQLSSVLKLAETPKKKLTLSRLSSTTIPFTILSVVGNPCNEDFLVICGLRDCHVLTYNGSGSVTDHLVLHPHLESGNFIIKAIWLPGTQTRLALVTADFVKVYDLGKDVLSPLYYFLPPTGKIRDVTFICPDDTVPKIVIMSSVGYIYIQDMDDQSLATRGQFIVTNTLGVENSAITDANGQICGGGVSVYYSHTLGILFLSYADGKSFVVFDPNVEYGCSYIYEIVLSSNTKSTPTTSPKTNSSTSSNQSLCQWTEVLGHPGLVFAMIQSSNTPVILMVEPTRVLVQEVKILPAKVKILDMAIVRHQSASSDARTTLILMCEDGSLRLYAATQQTGYWLSSKVHPVATKPYLKVSNKKKKTVKSDDDKSQSGSKITLPVDFFENCTQLSDVEFGGNDVLQIYNVNQLKTRLNTPGLTVVCNKTTGIVIEVTCTDNNQVITGVRIQLGTQDSATAPTHVEIFGRTIVTNEARNRWFDFPFTRSESSKCNNKVSITFGPSQNLQSITQVDSIKVYGKSKDQFVWSEDDNMDNAGITLASNCSADDKTLSSDVSQLQSGPLEKVVCGVLDVLESCFGLMNMVSSTMLSDQGRISQRGDALNLATRLVTLPCTFSVNTHSKLLLASLFPNRTAYHAYKDKVILTKTFLALRKLQSIEDVSLIDPEEFFDLVFNTRSIILSRPHSLGKLSLTETNDKITSVTSEKRQLTEQTLELVNTMVETMWRLHGAKPTNPAHTSIYSPGLRHIGVTVCAIVEIIHSLLVCDQSESTVNSVIKLYLELLLCSDTVVSFATKVAIGHGLKPNGKKKKSVVSSPTRSNTPGPSSAECDRLLDMGQTVEQSQLQPTDGQDVDDYEVVSVAALGGQNSVHVGEINVEELLGAVDYQQMDTDDETMVELAIALSLQEHDENDGEPSIHVVQQGIQDVSLQELNAIDAHVQNANQIQQNELGHFSDVTASAAGSDDEGSTAATDGSTLRTSPAEQGGSAESESGGSVVDSIIGEHNVSGRSSAYEADNLHGESINISRGDTSNLFQNIGQEMETDTDVESDILGNLHTLQIIILEKCIDNIPSLKKIGGIQIIPYLQVVLMLTEDLNMELERDRNALERLIKVIVSEVIKTNSSELNSLSHPLRGYHPPEQRYQFLILRFLSVLMTQVKAPSSSKSSQDKLKYVSTVAANILMKERFVQYCLSINSQLLSYWKNAKSDDSITVVGALLKSHPSAPIMDASPFFLKQYVKDHYVDMFDQYDLMLTELATTIPYQIQKHASGCIHTSFEPSWLPILCEYMMVHQMPSLRRQVRKLLLFMCGGKERYRHFRDVHALETHMKAIFGKVDIQSRKCGEIPLDISLPYDSLVEIVEHLKACMEIAVNRTANWQYFLTYSNEYIPNLFLLNTLLDENVSLIILQLLQCAINNGKTTSNTMNAQKTESSKIVVETLDETKSNPPEEVHSALFIRKIHELVDTTLLSRFIRTFLLETNSSNLRWHAHALIINIFNNSDLTYQTLILDTMWNMWSQIPSYGRRATQFVDLVGYCTIKCSGGTLATAVIPEKYLENTLSLLHSQNQLLINHTNASLYSQLAPFVVMDGYYLENDPCLVCNNPEVQFTNIKLSAVKLDAKYTTTTQIVKLVNTHMINKISLRIGDLKRTKMVRTLNIYYNNKNVQAVVELKNRPAMWHKAKKVVLTSGQTDVKIEFPLPIVASNLMIEYVDYYENLQTSTETLQCPRCSATVSANPGVCGNCGENVFQCHKCRAINYDEKDPFLCHVCGFCKYAKFDYTLTAKQVCAIEPIENDAERKKVVNTIHQELERADKVFKTICGIKPTLESLLIKISERQSDLTYEEIAKSGCPDNTNISRTIQLLAQKYCGECKHAFEELSRIIQKILVCRKELVTFDQKQFIIEKSHSSTSLPPFSSSLSTSKISASEIYNNDMVTSFKCFGCASYAVEHSLTLLKALCANTNAKKSLCTQGLLTELVECNLRRGTNNQMQEEVKQLLCMLTKDNPKSTKELCDMLMEHVSIPLRSRNPSPDFLNTVRPEINLLATMLQKDDSCWEQKAKCLMKIFLKVTKECTSPSVMEALVLPCLNIIYSIINPPAPKSRKNKEKSVENLSTIRLTENVNVNIKKWIEGDPDHLFKSWKRKMPPPNSGVLLLHSKETVRKNYLIEKYYLRWKNKTFNFKRNFKIDILDDPQWLKYVLFNCGSRQAREVACNLVKCICNSPVHQKKIIDILTDFLPLINIAGSTAAEFLSLYHHLIVISPWKQYLTSNGMLMFLAELFEKEIQNLEYLEQTTLTSVMDQGYILKKITELIASFLYVPTIKQKYKGKLVSTVLNGYLALRRLIVQRTSNIDEAQDKLLGLLEELTSGTESETEAFMEICIKTVEKCNINDIRTPVFIFERLCSIIFPEENEIGEFHLSLDKDVLQEEFLQGRMLGNPYSSNEPGLGPLMRDVKNKICLDCELVALLDDDNGMELLVNNKIISLDLPVKLVYKKIWLAEGGEGDAMRVVYRMRGLLGDATEEFIETIEAKSDKEVDNEQVYKMANVMATCDGLSVMLERLSTIRNLSRCEALLQVLIKLLGMCVKVKKCLKKLIDPKLNVISRLLSVLDICFSGPVSSPNDDVDEIIEILRIILSSAATEYNDDFAMYSQFCGSTELFQNILQRAVHGRCHNRPLFCSILAALTYGNVERMSILTSHFGPALNFESLDGKLDGSNQLDFFSNIVMGIEQNALGNTLRNYLASLGVVDRAMNYLTLCVPSVDSTFSRYDSTEWKEYISKPGLKYILKILTGLANDHQTTQMAFSPECITIIHRLEQVASDEHVGPLAENLLEALCTNPEVATRIENVREHTRAEKKRLAMAMRDKQLGSLGMRINEKGQVMASEKMQHKLEDLPEETGLVCVICREGYRFQPTKVLGLYTFTKRCVIEEFEKKTSKTYGYSTVTHFNIIHADCHMAAVRLARTRDEWESAALQNANTRCNGLLPLWGPQVPESAFANCLARHTTYLQECTGHRDITYATTVHDLKLLLLRFAENKSFHEDTGGGGPQSNMQMVPYLMHMALYVLNTTRCASREEKKLSSYLSLSPEKWVSVSQEVDGPMYWAVFSLLLHSPEAWRNTRVIHLRRLIIASHVRTSQKTDFQPKDYQVYKSSLIFYGLIDSCYKYFFKGISVQSEDQWPTVLADHIRNNDEALLKASEKIINMYTDELLPCTCFGEFCDVVGLLDEITSPATFIADVFALLGNSSSSN